MSSNDENDSTETHTVSRRGVIASVGAAFTLSATPAVAKGDDTAEIPYVVTDDEVLKHKKVPQSWLEHTRRVLQTRADFGDQVGPMSGSESVGVARSSETYGGKRGLKIQVATNDRTQDVVPSEVNGVEIEVVEKEDWRNACYYETPDRITGGLPIEARWEDGGESYTGWGTAGFPVKDSNGNERLLTADHLWENKSCQSSEGEEATQYTQDFGEVAQSEVRPDFALVEKTNGSLNLSAEIREEDDTQDVSGWFPVEAISELVSEGKSVHKMGVTTGKTTGTIDAMNQSIGNGCTDLEDRGVVVNGIEAGEGDSGGPMYRIEDIAGIKYAVLVGHTTHATNINDSTYCVGGSRDIGRKAAGHAWFHKNNEYELTI